MTYEMISRKAEPTLLPNQGIVNLLHHIGMEWEKLAFDDDVSHAQWGNGLQNVTRVTGLVSLSIPRVTSPVF